MAVYLNLMASGAVRVPMNQQFGVTVYSQHFMYRLSVYIHDAFGFMRFLLLAALP